MRSRRRAAGSAVMLRARARGDPPAAVSRGTSSGPRPRTLRKPPGSPAPEWGCAEIGFVRRARCLGTVRRYNRYGLPIAYSENPRNESISLGGAGSYANPCPGLASRVRVRTRATQPLQSTIGFVLSPPRVHLAGSGVLRSLTIRFSPRDEFVSSIGHGGAPVAIGRRDGDPPGIGSRRRPRSNPADAFLLIIERARDFVLHDHEDREDDDRRDC